VACQTLVLHATGDLRVPFSEGRLFASGIAQARFVPLDSRNHLMLGREPAWRRWTKEVDQFMGAPKERRMQGAPRAYSRRRPASASCSS
jgi:hypothetical protein